LLKKANRLKPNKTPIVNLPKTIQVSNILSVIDIKERCHAQAKESPGFARSYPLLSLRIPLCAPRTTKTPTLNLLKKANRLIYLDIKESYHAQAKESPGFT
jgi:hypothetical protein